MTDLAPAPADAAAPVPTLEAVLRLFGPYGNGGLPDTDEELTTRLEACGQLARRLPSRTARALVAELWTEALTREVIPPIPNAWRVVREAFSGSPPVGAAPSAALPLVRVLDGEAPDPPAVLVDGLLVDRDVTVWAGHGGAFKSVLALVAAVCVALGRSVFGSLAVHRPGPVLIVAPEDGVAAVRMMVDAVVGGLELNATDQATVTSRLFIVPDGESVNLCTDTARLGDAARAVGAVLVVLDPLRNLLAGADENDNSLAGAVLDALRRDVCRAAGAAALLTHHSRKPGKDGPESATTIHEMRGAGAWANGARLVFGVTARGTQVTMSGLKANRLPSDLRHELRLEITADPAMPTRWVSCTVVDMNAGLGSESFTPGIGRALNGNERATLTALDDTQEPGLRLSWSGWEKASGLKPDTWKGVRVRLLKAQLAEAIATGRRTRTGGAEYAYQITDRGRQALANGGLSDMDLTPRRGEGVSNG